MSGKLNLPSRAEISGIRSGNPVFSRIYRILPDQVTEPRTYRHMSDGNETALHENRTKRNGKLEKQNDYKSK